LVGDGKGSVVPAGVDEPLPKPHEAVVAVEAVSINRGEIFRLELAAAGWRPGKDFAGVFVRAAGDGSGPVAGTRVVGHGPHHSRWAEHVAISIDRIVDAPPDLSGEIAAALPLSGLTALRLARSARLSPGTSVLMTGVSGGGATPSASSVVGAGAYLIAIVRMQLRDEVWRRFGATTLTDVTDAPTEFDVGMESIDGTSLAEVRKGGLS